VSAHARPGAPALIHVSRYVIIAALALALGSCSGGDDGGESATVPSPSPAATASPTAAPSATPDALADPAPDGNRAYEHVRHFTQAIGARVAGTENEIEARDYAKRVFESYGYDVQVQEFPFDGTRYRSASVQSDAGEIAAVMLGGSPSGSVSGPIVAAGLGRPEEFPAGGLGGAIALVERGDLTFVKKAENAAAAGAGAVIVFNNTDGLLIAEAEGIALPMVAITREDGQALLRVAQAPAARASVNAPPAGRAAFNVIARPRGATACATVAGGHYDSVPGVEGADDNASGAAGVLELARVVAANRLPGNTCFALFGAEEFGLFGSLAFVEAMSDAEINGLRAMLNLDVIGTGVPMTLIGSDDLVELARIEAQEIGVDARIGDVPVGSGSDHFSFERAGVPVVFFYRHDSLIHTQQDALDRIVPQSLDETITVAYRVLQALNGG
jgi:Iap family predicted aminopeptidase